MRVEVLVPLLLFCCSPRVFSAVSSFISLSKLVRFYLFPWIYDIDYDSVSKLFNHFFFFLKKKKKKKGKVGPPCT
jgi:hypothetical protein